MDGIITLAGLAIVCSMVGYIVFIMLYGLVMTAYNAGLPVNIY